MTLLDVARGPAMQASILIMIVGLAWRLAGIWLLPRRRDLSDPRASLPKRLGAMLTTIVRRMWPRRAFLRAALVPMLISYGFHIGLLVILLGGAPHILLVKATLGLGWAPLPKGIIALASGITLMLLAAAAFRRWQDPVLRLLSTFDDWCALVLTILPVLTGILLAEETFSAYETLLALHIFSVEALMIAAPFGKLSHAVFVVISRATLGLRFSRKGASI